MDSTTHPRQTDDPAFKYSSISLWISKEILVNSNSVADDDSDNDITAKEERKNLYKHRCYHY